MQKANRKKIGKKGEAIGMGGILGIIVLAIIIGGIGFMTVGAPIAAFITGFIGGTDTPLSIEEAAQETARNACKGGETQTMTLSASDEETGAEDTGRYVYRKVGTKIWKNATFGSAVTGLDTGTDYD